MKGFLDCSVYKVHDPKFMVYHKAVAQQQTTVEPSYRVVHCWRHSTPVEVGKSCLVQPGMLLIDGAVVERAHLSIGLVFMRRVFKPGLVLNLP